ncbi:CWF19-like protein 1 [Babesia microti strain RI]|uniref:CWF19-like protein 1 n=1 Tax=Babesia microti (strain RI) TaxID=1133968 RepID=A0A1N6LYC4_BABMR|nr:CWF19-like protein 1 [Babesia microti strain RI]SIO73871.1 CWF19-like protein 1 [Babesia microti strain RI]|eukprot:XP_021337923.1 CWF19-like protein 1 [Babesia microti strain RI]
MACVRIWDLSPKVDEESLNRVMSYFGTVVDCRVIRANNEKIQANAYVTFEMEESAKKAASADRKLECGGCPLRIELHEGLMFGKIASTPQPGCWFCLANDSCEIHMISYVFNYCYLAIAKGALNKFHCIITSIDHFPNLLLSPPAIREDIKYAVNIAINIIINRGQGAIAFERYMPMNSENANHLQVQVAAVPIDTAHFGNMFVKKFKHIRSEPFCYTKFLEEIPEKIYDKEQSYFLLHQVGRRIGSSKISESCYLWIIDKDKRIPLQIGRKIIVDLMDQTEIELIKPLESQQDVRSAAVNWRNCQVSREEEERSAKNLMELIKNELLT